MYWEGTADILDAHGCGVDTHVFIYTHTPSAADSLRPRDGTQWFRSSHAALQWQIGTVALIYDKACTSQSCWYQSIELDISLPDHE